MKAKPKIPEALISPKFKKSVEEMSEQLKQLYIDVQKARKAIDDYNKAYDEYLLREMI